MADNRPVETCPSCGSPTDQGRHRANGLSFVTPDSLEKFLSIDEDVAKAGYRKFLPSKAEYYRSYLCRVCNLYVVDYALIRAEGHRNRMALPELQRRMTGWLAGLYMTITFEDYGLTM